MVLVLYIHVTVVLLHFFPEQDGFWCGPRLILLLEVYTIC